MCSDSGCVALPAHRAQQLRSTAQQLRSSGAQQLCLTNLDSAYLRFNPYVRPSYTQWRSCSPPPLLLPPLPTRSFHLPSFPPSLAPLRPALQHELYQLQGAMVNSGRLTMAGGAPGGSSSSDPLNGQLNKSLARAVIKLGARVSVLESKVGA